MSALIAQRRSCLEGSSRQHDHCSEPNRARPPEHERRDRCSVVPGPHSSSTHRLTRPWPALTRPWPARRSGRPHWGSRPAFRAVSRCSTRCITGPLDLVVAVQAIHDAARYHVDIETDDVPAEVRRLTGLGASEVSSWQRCRTLEVTGGHLLCVIPLHSDPATFPASPGPGDRRRGGMAIRRCHHS
jgi:hypothetical protein